MTAQPLSGLRDQWQALATEPLDGLPKEALIASIRDLAGELLLRTGPAGGAIGAGERQRIIQDADKRARADERRTIADRLRYRYPNQNSVAGRARHIIAEQIRQGTV